MTTPEDISAFFEEVFGLSAEQSIQAEVQARDQCKNGNASLVVAVSPESGRRWSVLKGL